MSHSNCAMSLIQKKCPREVFKCRRCMEKMKNTGRVWKVTTAEYLNSSPLIFPPFSQKLIWEAGASGRIFTDAFPDDFEQPFECQSATNAVYYADEDITNPISEAEIDAGILNFYGDLADAPNNIGDQIQASIYAYYLNNYWRIHLQYHVILSAPLDPDVDNTAFYYIDGDYVSEETDCNFVDPVDFQLDIKKSTKFIETTPAEYEADPPAFLTVQLVDIYS